MLHIFQELNKGEVGFGSGIEPLTKPSLFFADKALVIDLVHHGQFSVVSGFETKTIPGLSALGAK